MVYKKNKKKSVALVFFLAYVSNEQESFFEGTIIARRWDMAD